MISWAANRSPDSTRALILSFSTSVKVTPDLLNAAIPLIGSSSALPNWTALLSAVPNPAAAKSIAAAVAVLAVSILAVNAAMMLNPAILITAGIVALGVAVVAAYKKFEGLRTVVRVVVNGILGFVEKMVNAFIIGINVMVRAANLIPGVDIDTISHVSLPQISDKAPDLSSNDRGMGGAAGFTAPSLTGNKRGVGGAAGYNVTVNAGVGDPVAIGKSVVDALNAYKSRTGSLGLLTN